MNVEIPASLYALLQQQKSLLASQQAALPPLPQAAPQAPSNPTDVKKARSAFVDRLIDTSSSIIESIWPSQPAPGAKVLPLKVFIQEILRRSGTSCSTLQLALFYIVRLRNKTSPSQPDASSTSILTPPSSPSFCNRTAHGLLPCGRRMFLTALILASKYLQDRNYSNKAWSKISGLTVAEINANEFKFLAAVEYELFVGHEAFANWTTVLMAKTQQLQQQMRQQLQQKQQQLVTPWVQQISSLEVSCKPCDSQAVVQKQPGFAAVALSLPHPVKLSHSPVSVVSPPFGCDFMSPASVDDNVPQTADMLKRGRSYCDEDDSFVKRVRL